MQDVIYDKKLFGHSLVIMSASAWTKIDPKKLAQNSIWKTLSDPLTFSIM